MILPKITSLHIKQIFIYLFKWTFISLLAAVLIGFVSTFFLVSLDRVTSWREANATVIYLLPLAGLAIGLLYHYLGVKVVKGNSLIIEEFNHPTKIIPFRMAPLVLIGTLITHFFGGSAGREGTAVQMGGAIADQMAKLFGLNDRDRKIILIIGVSASFSAVFGTPLAGAVFALEIMRRENINLSMLIPSLLAAFTANYCVDCLGIIHIKYHIPMIATICYINLFWAILAGIIFGLCASLFLKSATFFKYFFESTIDYPPFRPFVGGVFIALAILIFGTTKYIGLGIPTIVNAFTQSMNSYDFALKILFTTFTLSAGFKGGEVTPLFFIGATLGNVLACFVPLPMGLLAGMGFVAVFAAATNAPIACTLMGIELFGIESVFFVGIACFTAYLFAIKKHIYSY